MNDNNYENNINNNQDDYNKYGRYGNNKSTVSFNEINWNQEVNENKTKTKKDKKNNKFKDLLLIILIFLVLIILILVLFLLLIDKKEYNLNIINSDRTIKKISCASYKIFSYETGCDVTFPTITGDSQLDLGYSLEDNLEVKYHVNDTINLENNLTVYAIAGKIITVNFVTTQAEYLEYSEAKCLIHPGEKTCDIKIPYIDKKGEYRLTFNTKKDNSLNSYNLKNLDNLYFLNKTYSFSEDITLYETIEEFAKRDINVSDKYKVNNTYIEIDNTCTSKQKEEIKDLFENVNNKWPFLLELSGKISFLSYNNFYRIWAKQVGYTAVGITTFPIEYQKAAIANIDVSCDSIKTAAVHEMFHRYDYNYALNHGKLLSEEQEVINLYNKYRSSYYNRPFRQYAYTSSAEFLAEAYKYYYYTYIEYDKNEAEDNYPNDVKTFVEKHLTNK